jgi:sialate O-acetylesterase
LVYPPVRFHGPGGRIVKRYLLLLWILTFSLRADVTVPPIFGSHMVLQQGVTLPIWGKASPGEHVLLNIGTMSEEAVADSSGKWRMTLRPLPLAPEPFSIVINGKNRIQLDDVITGDVWICAGEGNMAFPLADVSSGKDPDTKIPDQKIRFFKYDRPFDPLMSGGNGESGRWVVCSPSTDSDFSAVGYFFARDIASSHRLPIGMIQCTKEDSPIISWISKEGVSKKPSLLSQNGHAEQNMASSACFDRLIKPIIPYAITGVIWYQGESDEGNSALQYRRMLIRLIRDWRASWGEGPFSFYFVSQAGFGGEYGPCVETFHATNGALSRGWPWLRESTACALSLPFTGMAQAGDLGVADEKYPPDKLDVGRRLALLARHRVYGEEIVDSGPIYREMKIEGDKVRVTFDSVGGGLVLGNSPAVSGEFSPEVITSLRGFALAGEDHKWFPAQGRIEGNCVILWSDAVHHPEAVRYGWKGFPNGTLYNIEGLPASPFRSDRDQPE